ncbi:MAG: hypothetical protein AVDCRST_MAG59-4159 [uncultured Thermomicrobiales bacterium]|uniref:DUF1772 domain-containing protein n=1 Tax=uncultured Thermomicrobiales bacterium TaxID=1645740 RepID=A0A6J4VDJ7_9BACT|nr:MAG: hypothetical protein AVDCRST_MAG59-4159 [uncultured Thermomicrobiales bacterium]
MRDLIQVLSTILAAVAMALALAHALELPGKLRLTRDEYLVVQPIYYPGFTIGGVAEPLGLLSTAILLFLTPAGSRQFWLGVVALLGLIGMQAVYWIVTHPVNRFWLRDEVLGSAGAEFFAADPGGRAGSGGENEATDWTALRDRWERSHVARAVLGFVSFIALVVALV